MSPTEQRRWAEQTFTKLERKVSYAITQAQKLDFIPYTVQNGRWEPGPVDGICWWTNGFWPAEMWRMYTETGDGLYLQEARRAEALLDAAFTDFEHLHHDVGFLWRISAGFDFDLTGNGESRRRTLLAANLLAGRYNPNGFLRAWNSDRVGWVIVDSLMNLSLLYWAWEHTGDPRFRLIARNHADTVLKYFIRPDGTSEHIVIFDPETGAVLDKPGGQGYGPGSVWSRGQAWAIYGFTISYRHTGLLRYLQAARRVADAFLKLVGTEELVDCDLRQPAQPTVKDDCAGAIAACGLLAMADALGEEGAPYRLHAFRLLKALGEHHADWTQASPAILTHCTGSYHTADHHIAMVYGDYYFIEGVCRFKGDLSLEW